MSTVAQQLNDEMAEVLEVVAHSLVQVHSDGSGAGAGTVWHPDGLIITNAHVVRKQPLRVTLQNGETLPAQLLAYDSSRDLAALSVEASELPTIPLGDSRMVQPGQWVLAVGHPWGVLGAATAGVVIGAGFEHGDAPREGLDMLTVALHLRPGYSGGPLGPETLTAHCVNLWTARQAL